MLHFKACGFFWEKAEVEGGTSASDGLWWLLPLNLLPLMSKAQTLIPLLILTLFFLLSSTTLSATTNTTTHSLPPTPSPKSSPTPTTFTIFDAAKPFRHLLSLTLTNCFDDVAISFTALKSLSTLHFLNCPISPIRFPSDLLSSLHSSPAASPASGSPTSRTSSISQKVMIWDDHQSRCIGELSFHSEVKVVSLPYQILSTVVLYSSFLRGRSKSQV